MSSYFSLPSAIRKRPLTTIASTILLGTAGVAFIVQGLVTGLPPAGDTIFKLQSGSGKDVMTCDDLGGCNLSGTLTVGSIAIAGTFSGNVLHADAILSSSGALDVVGDVKFQGTTSGAIIHAEQELASSGTLNVDGVTNLRGSLNLSNSGLEDVYQQTITVAKAGGDYTNIQDAIDSITDNTSTKRYAILIYPGIYEENIIMEDWVSLIGMGARREDVIIRSTTGAVIAFASDAGNKTSVRHLHAELLTTTDGQDLITMSAGQHAIRDVGLIAKSPTDAIAGSIVDMDGGTFNLKYSTINYSFTGSNASPKIHNVLDLAGTVAYAIDSVDMRVTVSDINDVVIGINEDVTGTVTEGIMKDCYIHMDLDHGAYTGMSGLAYLHGAGTNKYYQNNHVHITSDGGGTAYAMYIDTTGNNGRVNTNNNHVEVSGFTNNYNIRTGTGDTMDASFDSVTATSGNSGFGILRLVENGDGEFFVSGTSSTHLLQTDITTDRIGISTENPETKLEVVGIISGSYIHAAQNITASGDIIAEGTVSGATLYSEGDVYVNGSLLMGTSTGLSVLVGDNRYVNVGGDTMTGDLIVETLMSGAIIHAEQALISSGTLSVTQSGTFLSDVILLEDAAKTYYGAVYDSYITFDGNSLNIIANNTTASDDLTIRAGNFWIDATGNLSTLGTISATGAIITDGNISLNQDNGAADAVLTFGNDAGAETITFSDTTNDFILSDDVHATGNLSTSGTLAVTNAVTLGSTVDTVGNITTDANMTLNEDNGGADAVLTFGNDAGAETITFSDSTNNFVCSDDVHTTGNLSTSGTLAVGSTVRFNGVTYTFPAADAGASGYALTSNAAGTLAWAMRLSASSADGRYVNVGGDTMTGELIIQGNMTGDTIHAENGLSSSGGLVVEGNMSGANALTLSGGDIVVGRSYFSVTLFGSGTVTATGTTVLREVIPVQGELRKMTCGVGETADDGVTEIDVKISGTSMFSTTVTIDATETGSLTAATPSVINPATNDFTENEVWVFSVNSPANNPAKNLYCQGYLNVTKTP